VAPWLWGRLVGDTETAADEEEIAVLFRMGSSGLKVLRGQGLGLYQKIGPSGKERGSEDKIGPHPKKKCGSELPFFFL
jgi:hypothetical protein